MRAALALSMGSLLLTAACGARPANDLSREEAWQASQSTYQSGSSSGNAFGAGIALNVSQSLEVPCPGGGSVSMDMAAAVDTDSMGAGNIDVNVNAGYNACTYEETTLDGIAAIAMSMSNSTVATSVSMTMTGDLWFTGAIEGSCSFNFSASVSVDPMSGASQVDLSGDYCGYDLDELEAEYGPQA